MKLGSLPKQCAKESETFTPMSTSSGCSIRSIGCLHAARCTPDLFRTRYRGMPYPLGFVRARWDGRDCRVKIVFYESLKRESDSFTLSRAQTNFALWALQNQYMVLSYHWYETSTWSVSCICNLHIRRRPMHPNNENSRSS